jgi:hypothetical protein
MMWGHSGRRPTGSRREVTHWTCTQMEKSSGEKLAKYDVEDRILESLKERGGVATAGDVAADTGLSYDRVEEGLRDMLGRYKSHLDVDDHGNLRYRFDPSFPKRGDQPGRWWYEFKAAIWKAFVAFFKVWTMLMLVGYTVTFVLILISLSVAALTAGDEDSGGGDLMVLPFYLLARMLEFIFYIDLFRRGSFGRRARRFRERRKADKPSEPFYQKIFHYLFGPEAEQERDPLETERAFAQFVRNRGGFVTAAEWAARSGQNLEEADNALTAGIVRFQGDVDVSDDGALVYRFGRLQVTAEEGAGTVDEPEPIWRREVSVPPLTGNPTSTNIWISVLNGFNLVMSSFVLFGMSSAAPGIWIGLGWVPFTFSALFFLIPLYRKVRQYFYKKRARRENERRRALSVVFRSAKDGEAENVSEAGLPDRHADELVDDFHGEVDVETSGETIYRFPEIARQYGAARDARALRGEDPTVFGSTIFSSDEEEKSLEESDMDEFDERLARELGDDLSLGELEESVAESEPVGEHARAE